MIFLIITYMVSISKIEKTCKICVCVYVLFFSMSQDVFNRNGIYSSSGIFDKIHILKFMTHLLVKV